MEKWQIFFLPGLEIDPSAVQPVASRYIDCAIHCYLKKDKVVSVLEDHSGGIAPCFPKVNSNWKYITASGTGSFNPGKEPEVTNGEEAVYTPDLARAL
jgi:hypothetical protein